jgi:flavin-dependent dehydrogenase
MFGLNSNNSHNQSSQAIVIGGGIAGLLAARVLSSYFQQVTVIERDQFPDTPKPRKGVPQSFHPHVLLVKGQNILQGLFPNLTTELKGKGAYFVNWTADFRWRLMGKWTPRFSSNIQSIACTRNLLEHTIQQRLKQYKNIVFKEGYQVKGLLHNSENQRIRGIKVRDSQNQETEMLAQLVVDTSGRGSQAPKWLEKLGYKVPQETTIKSFLGYATRWYQSLSDTSPDYQLLYVMPQAPNHSRGAVVHHVEGDRWLVNLIGIGKDYPPTQETDFLEFARTMEHPAIYDAIKEAVPISPIYGYRRTDNRWRHYEQLSHFPDNFIVLGDAACAFNPVYGQGITVATFGADTLAKCLKQHKGQLKGFSRRFQKQLAKANKLPWLMATGDDFRWQTTEGGKPNVLTRLLQKYLDQVMKLASEDQKTYEALMRVFHYLKPVSHLFQPYILWQLLKQGRNNSLLFSFLNNFLIQNPQSKIQNLINHETR